MLRALCLAIVILVAPACQNGRTSPSSTANGNDGVTEMYGKTVHLSFRQQYPGDDQRSLPEGFSGLAPATPSDSTIDIWARVDADGNTSAIRSRSVSAHGGELWAETSWTRGGDFIAVNYATCDRKTGRPPTGTTIDDVLVDAVGPYDPTKSPAFTREGESFVAREGQFAYRLWQPSKEISSRRLELSSLRTNRLISVITAVRIETSEQSDAFFSEGIGRSKCREGGNPGPE